MFELAEKLVFWCLDVIGNERKGLAILNDISIRCAKMQGIGSGDTSSSSGEETVLQAIKSFMGNRVTIFDVGANVGKYSEALMKIFSEKDYFIHAFEPSAATFSKLESSPAIKANAARIRLNNFALSDNPGEAVLYSNKPVSGLASLTKRRLDHFNISFDSSEACRLDTIDDYCARHDVATIDLLKIDVEGHELDVLKGAQKMLSKSAVSFVQFEFGGCAIDTRVFLQDFFYLFKPYQFDIYRITPKGYCQLLPSYKETDERFVTTNFLAVHRSVNFKDA